MITVVTMRPVTTKPRKSITAIIAHVLLDPDVGTYGTENVAEGKPWEKDKITLLKSLKYVLYVRKSC